MHCIVWQSFSEIERELNDRMDSKVGGGNIWSSEKEWMYNFTQWWEENVSSATHRAMELHMFMYDVLYGGQKKYLWTLHGCTTWWWAERNATGLRSSNTPSWLNISTPAISLLIFCLIICEHKTEDRYLWLFVNIKQTTIVFLSWNICTARLWRIAKYCLFLSAILVLPISSQEPEILVDINGNSLCSGTSSSSFTF